MLRVALAVVFSLYAAAASAAEPPCEALNAGTYPAPDQPPLISIWESSVEAPPPGCAGLPLADAKLVVTMRGSFRFDGTLDQLLTRVGAISTLERTRYWSTTEKKWLPLIKQARALRGADAAAVRPDFTAAELRSGATFKYLQQDNRASRPVIYRLRVSVRDRDQAIIDSENETAVRWFLVTLFEPGTLHSHVRLERVAPDIWGVAQLDWVGPGASLLALGHGASYVNRTAALFRHLAGIPSDQEPPAAP